ncbi:MAG: hypothetical protein Kow0068_09450 [Marinilabiliales bacterium]
MRKHIIYVIILSFFINSCITAHFIKQAYTKRNFNEKSEFEYDTEASFLWANETIYGKYYEKVAILIPVIFNNTIDTFYMQFDTGIPNTLLYERPLMIVNKQDTTIKQQIYEVNGKIYIKNPTFRIKGLGKFVADSLEIIRNGATDGYLIKNDSLAKKYDISKDSIFIIGSFGYDLIVDKTFLFDFKNAKISNLSKERLAYLKNIEYLKGAKSKRFPITIKTKINKKRYELFYDSGSSLWDVLLQDKPWEKIRADKIDTLCCFEAWDEEIEIYKKQGNYKVIIGENSYENVFIYTSSKMYQNKLGFKLLGIDGIIGNTLFLDKKILIDAKNNSVGIIK